MSIDKIIDISIINTDDRLIGGWANVEVVDKQGEFIPVEELVKAMIAYMSRGGVIHYGHENKPIGKVLYWDVRKYDDSKSGVYIISQINRGYKIDDIVWDMIKKGELKGFSIAGFGKIEKQLIENQEVRVLKDIELNEISIVDKPANPLSVIKEFNRFAKGIKTIDVPELMARIVKLVGDKLEKDDLEQIMQIITEYNNGGNNNNIVEEQVDNGIQVIEAEAIKQQDTKEDQYSKVDELNEDDEDKDEDKDEDDELEERIEEETGREEFEAECGSVEERDKDDGMVDSETTDYKNPVYGKKKRKIIIKNIKDIKKKINVCYSKISNTIKKIDSLKNK